MRFYWPIAKVDAEQRMVYGYATTEAEDDQGEIIRREAIAAALDDYMAFANIREMHQLSAVGVATEAQLDDKGLYLAAKIVDDEAWRKVIEGVYKGFSIGGRVTARDPGDRRQITGLTLTEISLVDRPANPEAVFDCWKRAGDGATAPMADSGAAGADRQPDEAGGFADPGYQPDGRKRYPLDNERHTRAAWAYIHLPRNAARYSADQLAHIKARIVAAWREQIDPHGPPGVGFGVRRHAVVARKGLDDAGILAQVVLDLDALHRRLTAEASVEEDGSPLPEMLGEIIAELCDLLMALVAEESGELLAAETGPAPVGLAAAAISGRLRKARSDQRPPAGAIDPGIAERLIGEIVPRLDALQKRVEDIAQMPLPPQTIARGLAGIGKREDGGFGLPRSDDVVAALARMSEEERTLTLIKAAQANPIDLLRRPG